MVETFCYINENIPSKTVNAEDIEDDCKIVLIEFSIKTCKWLCIDLYKPLWKKDNKQANLSIFKLYVEWWFQQNY